MRVLRRKLIRDLIGSVGTLVSIILLIAIGTGSFIGLRSAQRILEGSQASYYRQHKFADFWIDVKKAPTTAVARMAAWPEIAELQSRVVFDVMLDLPGVTRPLSGRLISTPPLHYDRAINGIYLIRGSGFSDTRDEEIIISEAFARAHDLEVGDSLKMILNRKRESFVIVGTAISPEYVYMVRGPGDILPDPEQFCVLYVKDRYAREVLDFKNACNQVVGRINPQATGDVDHVLDRIERKLQPYGVLQLVPRQRQASHRFLSDELHGLAVTANFMPAIFLGVAALALNIVMLRLVRRQRTTIGTLKALGYADLTITWHYLAFGLVVGIAGGIAGAGLGIGMSYAMIEMYKEFFQFPRFIFQVFADLLLIGIAVSALFSVGGTARGIRAVLRLQPADAMRQTPPERGGAIWLERIQWVWRRLSFRSQLALRSVFRNRFRTATSIIATALSVSIIFLALVMYDSFLYLVDYQFDMTARSDVDIGMREERSMASLYESLTLPSVDYAEPVLGVQCDLQHGRFDRRTAITGLSARHRLTTPRLANGEPVPIPPNGLVLSRKLAELLGARQGDHIAVTPIRGRRETKQARVASVVDTFLGMDCYADIHYLSRLVGEGLAINAVQLSVNNAETGDLYARVKSLPNAQGLSVRAVTKENIEQTLIATSIMSIGIMVLFAGAIAFGTTLNNSLVEIGDRLREISTLRVIGYKPGQVAGILIRQSSITFIAGLIIAFPLGYVMVLGLVEAYDSELYRLPVVVRPTVALLTAFLSVSFVAIAHLIVYWNISRLNWLEGVQVKE
ncbi:MAG: ABC transporter permease [Planctomycetota bacterium]|jgi:putative ABC transport system permease protein